jgi:hypothetical protein
LPAEKYDGFGAAVNLSVGCGDAHFPKQILGRQGKERLRAGILQSSKAEAAPFEGAAEAPGQRSAYAAIAVEEDPSAEGAPSFRISHF